MRAEWFIAKMANGKKIASNIKLDEAKIRTIVEEVVREFSRSKSALDSGDGRRSEIASDMETGDGLFENIEDAICAAEIAQKELSDLSLEKRKDIVEAIRKVGTENAEDLSRMTLEETGMGRFEDKVKKHLMVSQLTPGVEDLKTDSWSGDRGLTIVEMAPYGVIGVATPSTHPVPTTINNAISIIAAGNSAVFNPHPGAKRVSACGIARINKGIVEAGGPPNLLTTVTDPTIETAKVLFSHPKIRLLLVTGGPGVVKAVMESNKKAITAGPGNPPVVVDETADLERAAKDTVQGASFENNIICTAEKEVFVVESVADEFKEHVKNNNCHELTAIQIEQLAKIAFVKDEKTGHLMVNKQLVGRDASVLAEKIGVSVPNETRLLIGETSPEHVFVQEEQMMPFLPIVRVSDVHKAIDLAVQAEHGYGHTAVMHSRSVENMTEMARKCNTAIFVKNGPSIAGLGVGGEGHLSFSIAGPTGEGLTSPRTFTRQRRCTLVDYFRII